MKRIYVSGRIKDYPEYLVHFDRACELLARNGYTPVNPCEVVILKKSGEPTYEEYMKADIGMLLDCDAAYMLEGWERSAGARCEHLVAAMCGLEIMYEVAGELP